MKSYTFENIDELEKENPRLFASVQEATKAVIAEIKGHVLESLIANNVDNMTAIHSTFLRAVDDDDNIIYTEIQTAHGLSNGWLRSNFYGCTFYDDADNYNAARVAMATDSRAKFGYELGARDLKGKQKEI